MQTAFNQKPGGHKKWRLGFFYCTKKAEAMKDIVHIIALTRSTRIFFWLFILFINSPAWAVSFCAENESYLVNQPAKILSTEDAVNIAREYLGVENTINFKIKIEEEIITANTFNTYKILEPGINRLCWIVTLIVPDTVGVSRTVYIDKKSGEILGGYSSK
jgi:hypothetical protein